MSAIPLSYFLQYVVIPDSHNGEWVPKIVAAAAVFDVFFNVPLGLTIVAREGADYSPAS